ncbi:MAG: glycosyltransferase family 4 protein [Bacteroidia bacterium]|nr:glycosyltransferase family 4 protein [Bacteroidia bacterium]NND24793.1 glycosyltransferase family 4 protein [Flavobacteriaceae bacterium]NNE15742.1 glycosyltransferase family 4 protein [Saprospiraceae bacterium]NNK60007.1 glycosyltransferase family 4 protein [Flavobacteriaceae bacterium]RZW42465.1 MAG: glycosyltransferase [Flavobacteriaceae bacterium]
MKLAIISHTEHFKTRDGTIVGWGPTITEINHLLDIFDEIYHVAMFHDKEAPDSAIPYIDDRIKFVPLPALGGKTLIKKMAIIFQSPRVLSTISSTLKKVDHFQFRAPTGIGVFVIPYLMLLNSKKGWFKYAGNWNQKNAPLSYRIQKWLLRQQSKPVTINGKWDNQSKNSLSLENPCLTRSEINTGRSIREIKDIEGPVNLCFVGRLEKEKGVLLMIEALLKLDQNHKKRIGVVHLVGDGLARIKIERRIENSDITFELHGFIPREEVQKLYAESHIFILPSESEGFPKVIAEAMNYGCIPICSDVSSIGQYISNGRNGLLLDELTKENLVQKLEEVLNYNTSEYQNLIGGNDEMLKKFTFNYYNKRIKNEILK